MVARELAGKVGGEIDEFFLPRNFNKHCTGCFTCFQTELSKCPHYKELEPLEKAGKQGCNRRAKMWFYLMRMAHKHFAPMEPDYGYWEERGWHGKKRPWK